MTCHPSHTYGPGVDAYLAEEAAQAQQEYDARIDRQRDEAMVTEDPEQPPSRPSLGLPYVRGVENLRVLNYSYWNTNGVAMCIVAKEGGVADWAAYIGATNAANNSEEDTVQWVCRHGAKLSRKQANRWFPDLPIEAYRE
ncbi:hypothetical protein LCGC14_2329320 [marine sediment metagenome]|uniref:Uncharacterized protein n=1 Tax=marine sediment metagenome TaxID=412755 RepID=A0A0F9FAC9_9ZZZZ